MKERVREAERERGRETEKKKEIDNIKWRQISDNGKEICANCVRGKEKKEIPRRMSS